MIFDHKAFKTDCKKLKTWLAKKREAITAK